MSKPGLNKAKLMEHLYCPSDARALNEEVKTRAQEIADEMKLTYAKVLGAAKQSLGSIRPGYKCNTEVLRIRLYADMNKVKGKQSAVDDPDMFTGKGRSPPSVFEHGTGGGERRGKKNKP